jgi:TolB-like protein/DNA-binding winged helix-turn-helix (wHTH) protein/Flp pilus assembly protein TadD
MDTPLQIGEWRVDPPLDQITRGEKTVKLEPRAMRVLVCLAERAGQVVSVEQLLDAVWKDVVVTPDSVYQAVAGLRRALGDDTKEPAYITNVLRRGYRLIAPVGPWIAPPLIGPNPGRAVQPDLAAAPPMTAPPMTAPGWPMVHRLSWRWGLVLLTTVGALLAGGYWLAHRWVGVGAHGANASGAQVPEAGTASVGVLPFLDLSDTKDQQYFADGLTEELIERLATARRLHVAARSSSFYFKGKQAAVADIARTLRVSYLLEGSVRKAGGTLRVTTHLVRAEDGYDLWSQTYDRPLADVLQIQDQIASGVVHAFKMSVLTPEPFTSSADAHDEFLRAEALSNNGAPSDYDAAETHLRTALKLDPQFVEAWTSLAMVTIWRFDVRAPSPPPEACSSARTAVSRALELNPALALTHRAKGIVLRSCDHDFSAAEAEFNRALELQPENPLVLMSQALLAMDMNRPDRAIELASRATALDPLNAWAFSVLCTINLDSGRPVEAEASCRTGLAINPSAASIHGVLAIALLTNQKPADAVAETLREPDPQYRLRLLPIVLDAAGRKSDAERELKELQVRYGEQYGDWVALYYACRHDSDNAVQWLRTYAARHQELRPYRPYLRACLGNLESDLRYQELKRQLKFAPRRE